MPKLKPLSKDEDLRAIPVDEPVLVELEPAPTGAEIEEDQQEPELKADAKPGKQPDAEDGADILRKQMEDMRKANEARETRLARERDEARRDADAARRSAADTEADLITNGLKGAQSELGAAKAAVKAAFEAGDGDALADAQARVGRASADIRDFERAAASQAADSEREKEKPQQRQFNSVEESIDSRTDLTDGERRWLKDHQDAWVDPARNQELGVAYQRAVKAGHQRGTPEYFGFIEEFMGYRQPAKRNDDNSEPERTSIVAAPVSRDNRSAATGRVQTNQVMLTPAERDIARSMGITDKQYALGKLQLAAAKSSDPEKYGRTA